MIESPLLFYMGQKPIVPWTEEETFSTASLLFISGDSCATAEAFIYQLLLEDIGQHSDSCVPKILGKNLVLAGRWTITSLSFRFDIFR